MVVFYEIWFIFLSNSLVIWPNITGQRVVILLSHFFGLSSILIVEVWSFFISLKPQNWHFSFHCKTKMSDKSKRQTLSLFDINRCLEEFKTKDHLGKSNSELALVARDLLNLPKVPLRGEIPRCELFFVFFSNEKFSEYWVLISKVRCGWINPWNVTHVTPTYIWGTRQMFESPLNGRIFTEIYKWSPAL